MAEDLKEKAQSAINDVRSEAIEVVQEAKAAVKGEELESAKTVGGAGYREADNPKKNGPAVASLVLGILSLVCALFGYGAILGVILAIVGVVLGAKARKINQTGIATAGFVCSIIGVVLNGVAIVCVLACASAVGISSLFAN